MTPAPGPGQGDAPNTLAILDHRHAPVSGVRQRFRDRGWDVHTAAHPRESRELLRLQRPAAAVLYPLTLLEDGAEWHAIGDRLWPEQPVPWLLIPWRGAAPARVARLLERQLALADWASPDAPPEEIDARVRNLVRMAALFSASSEHARELEGQLITDHKTGLGNDRHFRTRLAEECERAERHHVPASLLLLDLDDFKRLNDEHSYEYGDQALRATGLAIRRSVRSIDIPARIGGDEFAVVLPSTTLAETVAVARRIHDSLRATILEGDPSARPLRASVGIATHDGRAGHSPGQWFLHANEALKEAKHAGKDRTCFFDAHRGRAAGAGRGAGEPAAERAGEEAAD